MSKNILPFALAFLAGAVIALAIRATRHDPYQTPEPESEPAAAAPAVTHHEAAPAGQDHTAHPAAPVNTVCPICGMDVDPDTPTAMYKGQVIGFGCKNCPEEFAANPALYGEAALKNQVVEE